MPWYAAAVSMLTSFSLEVNQDFHAFRLSDTVNQDLFRLVNVRYLREVYRIRAPDQNVLDVLEGDHQDVPGHLPIRVEFVRPE